MRRAFLLVLAALCAAGPAFAQRPRRAEIDSAEALVQRDSLDPLAHHELAVLYLRDRRYDDAEEAWHAATRLDPRLAVAYLGLGIVQDEHRDYWRQIKRAGGDAAVARERRARDGMVRRAFLLDPLVDISVLQLGDVDRFHLPLMSYGGYELAWLLIDQAWRELRDRHHVTVDSMPPGLLWAHGLLSAHVGLFPLAAGDLAALVHRMQRAEQDATFPVPLPVNEVRYLLAAVQQHAGNRDQAMALYHEVAENDLGNFMAQVQLARLHEAGHEWSQAIRAREAAILASPDDPTLQVDLAATLLNARFVDRAETVLVAVRPSLPRDPRVYYLLGVTDQALQRPAEAREAFNQFLAMAPSSWAQGIADARRRLAALSQ